MKEYTTLPNKEFTSEIVIEKSRFIASAKGVGTVEEAVEFVNHKRKQFFDATHNCYAYIVNDKAKYSDDGEPSGTAGMPILSCIKNQKLNFVCVVVTRYFGGIKLGAGGLVRAYGGCCAEVLDKSPKIQLKDCTKIRVKIDYSFLKPLRNALSDIAVELQVDYGEQIDIVFLFLTKSLTTITDIIMQITSGKAKITESERLPAVFDNRKAL